MPNTTRGLPMVEVKEILKGGIDRIISRYSPPGDSENLAEFHRSSHPRREILFVMRGYCRYMYNDSVYEASPGTLFLIDYWETHAFGYRKQDHDLLHLWLNCIGTRWWASFIEVNQNGLFQPKLQKIILPNDVSMMLDRRWNTLNQTNAFHNSPDAVFAYMRQPLNAMLDEICYSMRQDEGGRGVASLDALIEGVKRYIISTNGCNCSYEQLEKISGYSRFYLAHRFRKSEGCSIGEFIDQIRIDYTVQARRHGRTQKEIALDLGFSSASNYWLWLQKHKGTIHRALTQWDGDKLNISS